MPSSWPPSSASAVLEPLRAILRNRTVLTLGLAYFLLKPARYAILLWGPVIVYEQIPSVGKVGAAIVPTAFELAGLLGPVLIGLASDKLFGARRMPACVLSLLALTVTLALFMGALHTDRVALVMTLLFVLGADAVWAGLDDQQHGGHRLRHRQGRRYRWGFHQRFGGGDPGWFAARLFRYRHGFYRVCRCAALFSSLVLMPYWNARPAVLAQAEGFLCRTAMR